MIGRICSQKNIDAALDAASSANIPLLICGEVYPFQEDIDYFENEIKPRLVGGHRFLGPISFERKRRLLAGARCLLLPSLAPEMSSLISMDAIACGTPVIAYPLGAIPEVVENNVTGYLVTSPTEMADAITKTSQIDPDVCRSIAKKRFSLNTMIDRYINVYQYLTRNHTLPSSSESIISYVRKNLPLK